MAKMLIGEKNIPLLSCEKDIAEAFESIKESILWYKSMADRLREKVNYLESENYKDEELQKMKSQLEQIQEDYRRGFPITKEESDDINKWKKNHDATEHGNVDGYHGAIGGGYTYEFIPTSIGSFGTCFCSICKNKAMIAGATANTPAAKKNGFDKEVYNDYLEKHNGSFDFQDLQEVEK